MYISDYSLTESLQSCKQQSIDYSCTPEEQLKQAMLKAGITTTSKIIADGQIHRFHIEGDKPGSLNGWYILFSPNAESGIFGSWKTGEQHLWRSQAFSLLNYRDPAIQLKLAKLQKEQAEEKLKAQENTARRATQLWEASPLASISHPYLLRKKIQSHQIRQARTALLIPLIDMHGRIWNIQSINEDGTKRFMAKGRIKGCFFQLGELTSKIAYVCEGFSTGATIHELTGLPVLCAMSASNLLPTCQTLRQNNFHIIIAADNDANTSGNPGITMAKKAAQMTNSNITWPEKCGNDCLCSDFNDYFNCHGEEQ